MAIGAVGLNEFSNRILGSSDGLSRLFSLIKSLAEGILLSIAPDESPSLAFLRDKLKLATITITGTTTLPKALAICFKQDNEGRLAIYNQDKCEAMSGIAYAVVGVCQLFDLAKECLGVNFSAEAAEISSSIYRLGTIISSCCTVIWCSPEVFNPLSQDTLKHLLEIILAVSKAVMMILYKGWKQTYGYVGLAIIYGFVGIYKTAAFASES